MYVCSYTAWASRAVAALPRRLQTAAGPAGVGLRALRGLTWAAALTLATLKARGACFSAADAACLAAQRCAAPPEGQNRSPVPADYICLGLRQAGCM